jgi:tRNA-dihydrouridine synthase A
VQSGRFGACLMREPQLVAECMAAIIAAVRVRVSVKCRLGVDDQAPSESLWRLVDLCAAAGVGTFIVHARKAWLEGLSPKENREVPPLDFGLVRRLKAERPDLEIILNGGVRSLEEAAQHLEWADGVMLGRAAYHEPALLGEADARIFGESGPVVERFEAVERYLPYIRRQLALGTPLAAMSRHMIGLFHGQPGARAWRRTLTVEGSRAGAGVEVVAAALNELRRASARTPALEFA